MSSWCFNTTAVLTVADPSMNQIDLLKTRAAILNTVFVSSSSYLFVLCIFWHFVIVLLQCDIFGTVVNTDIC